MAVDLTFGVGVLGMILVGIVFLALAIFVAGDNKGRKQVLMIIGVAAIAFGLLTYALPSVVTEQASVAAETTYDVTATEAMSHVTYDSQTHTFVMALSFNDTSNAFVGNTQYLAANFTIAWANGPVDVDSVAKAQLGSVPQVVVSGAEDEYIIDQNADDSFKCLWEKSNAVQTYEDANVLIVYGGDDYATVNITLNAAAVAAMDENEIVEFHITVGGEMFTVEVLKDTVST